MGQKAHLKRHKCTFLKAKVIGCMETYVSWFTLLAVYFALL